MVYIMLCITAHQSSAGAGELYCSLPITPAATATYTFSGSISFCVVTIDLRNRKIHAVSYGAGHDRTFDY